MRKRATPKALPRKAWAFFCSSSSPLKASWICGSISWPASQARISFTLSSTSSPSATSALMVMVRAPPTRRSRLTWGWASRLTKLEIGTMPALVCTRMRSR